MYILKIVTFPVNYNLLSSSNGECTSLGCSESGVPS